MASEGIKHCDIAQITGDMARRGIKADFAGNKVVAWCSNQAVKIFDHLNDRYGLKLALPKAICVRDFPTLKINNTSYYSHCNWYPAYLPPNSDRGVSERTVLFNSFESKMHTLPESERWRYRWENIDLISEARYQDKISSS